MDQPTLILLILPVLLIQAGLLLFAAFDLFKNPNPNGPKWMWAFIILFFSIIGPILYFVIGRRNN